MYILEMSFECYRDTTVAAVEKAIMQLVDALRYNGQILGREFPTSMDGAVFTTRLVCPEQDSLHPDNHSGWVRHCLKQLGDAGLVQPKFRLLGQDLHSNETDPCDRPEWQILYTSFIHTCSPLRCGEHFAPIPLYKLPAVFNGDYKAVIKWQEDWEACDQLQMNGSVVEYPSLYELSDTKSLLFRRGRDLCKRIEYLSKIPTYYYLYRVGGNDLEQEQNRACPVCGDEGWRLEQPIHDIFDFKCDNCRLVSNLSWDFKK